MFHVEQFVEVKKSEKKFKYPLYRRAEFWYTSLTMKKEDLILSSQNAPHSLTDEWLSLSLEPTLFVEKEGINYLCRRFYPDLIEYRPCIVRYNAISPANRWKFRQILDDFVELNVKSPVLDYNPLLCSICLRKNDGYLLRVYSIREVL